MATKKIQILDSLNKNAVLFTPQELTDEQKLQARENINVPSTDEISYALEASLAEKADLVDGKIPASQLPDDIGGDVDLSDYYTKGETNSALSEKADLIDGKVPLSQLPDDIGGSDGATSWNDLDDRPFYGSEMLIAWDGNGEGKEMVPFLEMEDEGTVFGYYAVKVQDADNSSPNSVVGGLLSINSDGDIESMQVQSEMIVPYSGDCWYIDVGVGIPYVVNILAPTSVDLGMGLVNFNLSGLYFMGCYVNRDYTSPMAYTTEMSVSDIKTLDIKYLPKNMALGYEDKSFSDIIWDGNTDGLISTSCDIDMGDGMILTYIYYKVSDEFILADLVSGASCTTSSPDGEETYIVNLDNVAVQDSGTWIDTMSMSVVSCVSPNETITFEDMGMSFTFPEVGTYFLLGVIGGEVLAQTVSLVGSGTIKYIDEKFIPDSIARKSDLEGVSVDLSGYYTKSEVDVALENVSVDLSGYYTKSEIDSMFDGCDEILDEISTLIGE